MSPLVGAYNQWLAGHASSPALPRPIEDFLTGQFGPLSPLIPMPVDQPQDDGRPLPRRWQYPVGWNLPVGQPGAEGLKLATFPVLRQFADTYSVVRAMLNIRNNEMAGLQWDIGPTGTAQDKTKGNRSAKDDQKARAAQIVTWFRHADANYKGFQSWFSAALEDQYVIDAVAIHLLPPRVKGKGLFGSNLAQLELLNGETIRPLLDVRGATPRPPAPAYQQYLWGVPRADMMDVITGRDLDDMADRLDNAGEPDVQDPDEEYAADQLLYLKRQARTWTPYGFSPIEQALLPITIGLQRQGYLLDFYSEGTVPAVYVIAGEGLPTPAQQRQLQDNLNALAGDQAWKHRVIVLPPGSKTDPQKDQSFSKDVDSSIVEMVGMILHIQPNEIGVLPGGRSSGLGGKGQAQAAASAASEQRTAPDRKWWKETLFDWVIQVVFGQKDLEWKWLDFEEQEDTATKAAAQKDYITMGKTTIDEERIEDGLDPFNLPLTSTPWVLGGTGGIIPLDPTVPPPAAPAPAAGIGPDGQPLPPGMPGQAPAVGGKPNPFAKPNAPAGAAKPNPFGPKPPAVPGQPPVAGTPPVAGAPAKPDPFAKPGATPPQKPGAAPVAAAGRGAPPTAAGAAPPAAGRPGAPAAAPPRPGQFGQQPVAPGPTEADGVTPRMNPDGSPAQFAPDGTIAEPPDGVLFTQDEVDQLLDVTDTEVASLLDENDDVPAPVIPDGAASGQAGTGGSKPPSTAPPAASAAPSTSTPGAAASRPGTGGGKPTATAPPARSAAAPKPNPFAKKKPGAKP